MLATSLIKDLIAGNLSDQVAYQYLLDLNKEKLDAALINEVVSNILELDNDNACEQLQQSYGQANDLLDCCGTGGSGLSQYNTSTAVAFVLASGGLKVAKFGNRSATGKSGSFDFLDSLGIPANIPIDKISDFLEKTNLAFLFAPQFYPSLAKLAAIRKTIPQRTIFNIIGPLLNPLRPSFRCLGTTDKVSQKTIADYLLSSGNNIKSFVVTAESGLDEMDAAGNNSILSVDRTSITEIDYATSLPENISPPAHKNLTAADNARLFIEIISDQKLPQTYFYSLIVLNAAAAFLLAGKVKNMEQGQELSKNLLHSGEVLAKYEQCRGLYAQYT